MKRTLIRKSAAAWLCLVILFMAGCAQHDPRDAQERRLRDAYAKRLALVASGMTRRQLYAVLPPDSRPIARPPILGSFVSGICTYSFHHEIHPLGKNHCVEVLYQLARARDYPTSDIYPDNLYVNIERFLHGANSRKSREIPSVENPNDIIFLVSGVEEYDPDEKHSIDPRNPSTYKNHHLMLPGTYSMVVQQKGHPLFQ